MYHHLTLLRSCCLLAATFAASFAKADTPEHFVQLAQAAHVCNDEDETKRLAANDHLREMAKALVEFKATRFCFILQPAVMVKLLEQQPGYVKFSHDNQVLYTFAEHIINADNPAMITSQISVAN